VGLVHLPETPKGGCKITEQLNIVGKRSGEGFVSHKAMLVSALSRALADRLEVMDFTVGRKGFAGYIKSLSGSNIIKIVPSSNGSASAERATDKRLKVVCGANTSYLEDGAWIGDKTPLTFAELRVSPANSVYPNMGSLELAEALTRVLPFTATEDKRPILQCVLFVAKDDKLQLVSADGFRLAIVTLDYTDGEGQALVHRDDLKGIANALRKAKRVRLGFEASGDTLDGVSIVMDTEAIRYKWRSADGQFPNYEPLIPTECNIIAHLDTVEALKAVSSIKALGNDKDFQLDLTVSDGSLTLSDVDGKGEAVIPAETEGQGFVRLNGNYFADVLKACGGMVDFKLTNAYSPVLFTADGFQVVVMPVVSNRANEQQREDREAKGEATAEPTEAELEAIEAEPEEAEAKPKRSRKREKVAVA
jgi:DNA polymerase-3 subunit beta